MFVPDWHGVSKSTTIVMVMSNDSLSLKHLYYDYYPDGRDHLSDIQESTARRC
jgi:hypothetical protein